MRGRFVGVSILYFEWVPFRFIPKTHAQIDSRLRWLFTDADSCHIARNQ